MSSTSAAGNAFTALAESRGHVVREGLHLQFCSGGRVTGDVVHVRPYDGARWLRAGVPAGDWADADVPVICVVHDPPTGRLHWANATEQLRRARRDRVPRDTIAVPEGAVLDAGSLDDVLAELWRYAGRHRGDRAIRARLAEMSGAAFDPSDPVLHFVNADGDDLIFWQCRGEGFATLLHSRLGWTPEYVGPEMLRFETADRRPMLGELVLEQSEAMWIAACFAATSWARRPAPDRPHAAIRVEVVHNHLDRRIVRHLATDPGVLTRSAVLMRTASTLEPEVLESITRLESDPALVDEAMSASPATWRSLSPEAKQLVLFYLVEGVVTGDPADPIDRQIEIVWRLPRVPAAG